MILMDIGQGLSMILGLLRISTWKTNERPKKPMIGTFGFNTQTKSLEYFDGTDWYEAAMERV